MFVVLEDDANAASIAVLPLHFNYEILMKTRPGFPMMLGTTTEVKGEFFRFE